MPRLLAVDPGLFEYCTPRQEEVLRALVAAKGSGGKAAAKLGVHRSVPSMTLASVRKKAARLGYAPGHWDSGTAPGYRMGKVTVQRGPGGVERVWERQSPETASLESVLSQIDARAERIAPLPEIKAPAMFGSDRLFNQVSIFDGHIGALA